jgi:hypothetical protein
LAAQHETRFKVVAHISQRPDRRSGKTGEQPQRHWWEADQDTDDQGDQSDGEGREPPEQKWHADRQQQAVRGPKVAAEIALCARFCTWIER